jgi:energy-coupling factor transport system permease protein
MISSALSEVEERTMALEARAFSAPGRRTTIRQVPDGPSQRILRWAIGLGVLAAVVGTVAGWLVVP